MTLRRALALLCIGIALFAIVMPFEATLEVIEVAIVIERETPRIDVVEPAAPIARAVLPTHLPRAALS